VDKLFPKLELKSIPPEIPNHLPLKICLVGGKFSGRKTLANYIA
jgi:hypothetical protein